MADCLPRIELDGLDGVTNDVLMIAWAIYVTNYADEIDVEPGTLLEMDSNLIASWQHLWAAKEHDGDCTNDIHMCLVCARERLVEVAEAILNALPE